MKLPALLSIVGVIAILFGSGFVVAPAEVLAQYGVTADRYTVFMSRLFGGRVLFVQKVAVSLLRCTIDIAISG